MKVSNPSITFKMIAILSQTWQTIPHSKISRFPLFLRRGTQTIGMRDCLERAYIRGQFQLSPLLTKSHFKIFLADVPNPPQTLTNNQGCGEQGVGGEGATVYGQTSLSSTEAAISRVRF